jgi:hypothetical protein
MVKSRTVRRPSSFVTRLARGTSGIGQFGQIYGLGLLLLLMVFFMLTFRGGKVPVAVERVFATPSQIDDAQLQERRKVVAERLHGAWHDVPDGAPWTESAGYGRLLFSLVDHVQNNQAVTDPPLFDYDAAIRAPDFQRSETVKLRGVVIDYLAIKLDHPVFQITDVWRAFGSDGMGDQGFVVDFLEKPPPLEERRQLVEIVGQFYRTVSFTSETGEKRVVPYFLGRSVRVLPEERHTFNFADPANIVMMIAIGAMVVWAVARVVASRRVPKVRWRAPHPI